MSINEYRDPIVSQWESSGGVKYSKPISNEPHVVTGGMFALVGLPDLQARVQIENMVEIGFKDKITEAIQFKIDYTNGYVFVHSDKEGLTLNVNYASRGVSMYPASRIWTKVNDSGDVMETMGDWDNKFNISLENEAGRVISENARVSKENARISAETARGTSEDIREFNEVARVNAETTRINSEQIRIVDESTRKMNENTRVTNEDLRKSSEVSRIATESARVSAHSIRKQQVETAITDANAKIVDVESRFQTLTTEQQQDAEVVDARKGKTSLKAKIDEMDSTVASHKADKMPHLIKDEDTGKTYRVGRRFKDGGMQKIWEEVV